VFVEPMSESEKQQWTSTWRLLNIPGDVIHLLVEVFDLRCVQGKLLVVNTAMVFDDVTHGLHSLLLTVWKFRGFVDSRWLTAGHSSRSMVAASLTGISSMLEWAITFPGSGSFYLNGFWWI
jgi:hypothetical protein